MTRQLAKLLAFSILGFSFLSVVSSSTVLAVNPPTISVSPFLQQVNIKGDEPEKSFSVSFTNQSSDPQSLEFSILDFGTLDDTGGVAFVGNALTKKYGLSNWLSVGLSGFQLSQGETKELPIKITNDTSLAPGGHYAAVVAQVASGEGGSANSIGLQQKISSLILATKTGGEHYDMSLLSVKKDGNFWHLPTTMDLIFKGTGNVHVIPRGFVELKASNQVVSRGVINESSSYVLPESSRKIPVDLKPISSSKWWQTNYKLEISYRYEGIDRVVTREVSVRYVNIKAFGLAAGLVVVSLYLIIKYRHKIFMKLWKTSGSK